MAACRLTFGGCERLTCKGLDTAVDVLVLLEARGRGEGLAAVGAGVGPRPHVLRADVPLQVAGVREHLLGGEHGQERGGGYATPHHSLPKSKLTPSRLYAQVLYLLPPPPHTSICTGTV